MTFTLLLRRSSTPGHAPTTTQLNSGELSMNTNDGIIYFKQTNSTTLANTIVAIGPVPATANALTNPVTISLAGDASGSVSFNGTSNVSISTTLATVNTNVGTFNTVTVNGKGLVTAASNTPYITNVVASGDASGTSVGNALTLTLATVNTNVGSYGGSVTVPTITVNGKGLVTAVSNTAIVFPVTSVFGRTGAVTLQSSDVTGALGYTPVNNAVLGVANGVATLNSAGQLTASQLPSSITGALVYQGTWNAATNSPTLASGTGTKGNYYKVNVAGNTTLDGISTWYVGDTAVFDGSTWDKIDGIANEVVSVNGFTGNVVLTVTNISGAAPLASPALTGVPTAPTPALTDNSNTVATTAYVKGQNYVQGPIVASGGDATGTSVGNAITLTLATVNTNVGTFGTTTVVPTITVNGKGLVTAVSNSAIAFPVTSVFGRTGAVVLQSSDVTGALGYTPIGTLVASGDASGTSSGNTITLTLANVNSNIGTFSAVVVNAKGLVTSALNASFSGDVSGTSSGVATTLTLATVNTTVGTFGTATVVPTITVNGKGLVTAVSNTAITFPVTSVFGRTGAVVLQSSDVTGALGYTPVNNAVVGVANGVATLNNSGQLTASQLPSSVIYGAITASGDASGTSVGNAITLTLATVNTTPGTYVGLTINAKGLVTAAANVVTFAGYNLGVGLGPDIIDGGSF